MTVPAVLPDLAERLIETEQIADGRFLRVRTDRVRLPDGNAAFRQYVVHPGAVAIAAFVDADNLVFEYQYRYPLGRHFIELPAGKIDPGEEPLATGRRELLEETGYVAERWLHAATLHPTIGYSDERIELFVATGLRQVGHRRDAGEFLETFAMPLAEAIERVGSGEITDTKTTFSLLWLERFRDKWR